VFTGLIEMVGKIVGITRSGAAAVLSISADFPRQEVLPGDSVAINGTCLTLIGSNEKAFNFDISPETLQRTTFRNARVGMPVNLERALRLSDRLAGHIVSGHVDCVAAVAERRMTSGNLVLSFHLPAEFERYVAEKGSVAVDGVSLTVNTVSPVGFTVNIIPHTAGKTTLAAMRAGDEVNIETDIIGKYLERLLSEGKAGTGTGVTFDLLAKNGFM